MKITHTHPFFPFLHKKKNIMKIQKNKIFTQNQYQSFKLLKSDKQAVNECTKPYFYSVIQRNSTKMMISDKVRKDVKNASKL